MFGSSEVLVAAKNLVGLEGIKFVADCNEVTYVHFALDQHEIVYSNGAETETLYPGPEALRSVNRAARDELISIFPELTDWDTLPKYSREVPSGGHAMKLIERIQKNAQFAFDARIN